MPTLPRVTGVSRGVQAAYDAVARAYDEAIGDELARKPLDRALLDCVAGLAGSGVLADVGCGPGHVTRFLAERHSNVMGVDLSPGMIAVARERAPSLVFRVASMLDLPATNGEWSGIVAMYSIIHLSESERGAAFREFARVLVPGGWLLVAFHVDASSYAAGEERHITDWFGQTVDLRTYFLAPEHVVADIERSGLEIVSTVIRQPWPGAEEYPSRRCYLMARRLG